MDEARYRHNQMIRRLFGPAAMLAGTSGSARGPGILEIRVDGRTIGTGPSFSAALADASKKVSGFSLVAI